MCFCLNFFKLVRMFVRLNKEFFLFVLEMFVIFILLVVWFGLFEVIIIFDINMSFFVVKLVL